MLVECSDQKYLDFIYKRRKEMDVVNEFIHYIHLFTSFNQRQETKNHVSYKKRFVP